MEAAEKQGGVGGKLAKWSAMASAGLGFARLYLLPVKKSTPPASVAAGTGLLKPWGA